MRKITTVFLLLLIIGILGGSPVESEHRTKKSEQYLKTLDEESELLLKELGLSWEDYNDEGVRLREWVRASKKVFNNTYANLTVEKINEVFEDTSVKAVEIIEKIGKPDLVRISGKSNYLMVDLKYKISEESPVYDFEISWPMGKNNSKFYKRVVGKPADASVNYPYNQTIISDGEFKPAVYEK